MLSKKKVDSGEAALIRASDLFDAKWYNARYKIGVSDPGKLAAHFLAIGGVRGFSASPRFISAAYLALNRDVARERMNPLFHYLRWGRGEGRAAVGRSDLKRLGFPDMGREAQQLVAIVAGSTLFDTAFYTETYSDVAVSGLHPILHYVRHGLKDERDPGPEFDAKSYLAKFPELRGQFAPPLVHFEREQAAQKTPNAAPAAQTAAVPAKNMAVEARPRAPKAAAEEVPAATLADQKRGPEFKPVLHKAPPAAKTAPKVEPVARELAVESSTSRRAAARARAPANLSSVATTEARIGLAKTEPAKSEIEADTLVPLVEASPKTVAAAPSPAREAAPEISETAAMALIAKSGFFDAEWYVKRNPDATKSGLTPLLHYVRVGAAEGRQPSLLFDPEYYRSQCAESVIGDPLAHFLTIGQAEGRTASPLALRPGLDPRVRRLGQDPVVAPLPVASRAPVAWTRHDELQSGPGLKTGGVVLGRPAPGLDFRPLFALLALLRVEDETPGISDADGQIAPLTRPAEGVPAPAPRSCRFADGWFASERALRLRFGDEAGDADGDAPPSVVRLYQGAPGRPFTMWLCGEVIVPAAGGALLDATLANPLLPVLFVVSSALGDVTDLWLLPFPSLLRGGLHNAELLAVAANASPIDDLLRYGDALLGSALERRGGAIARIGVDRGRATGAEQMFSADMRAWIAALFGPQIVLEAAGDEVSASIVDHLRSTLEAPGRTDAGEGASLLLPADATPTIAALAGLAFPDADGKADAGAYLVVDAVSARPRLSVAVPAIDAALAKAQPAGASREIPALGADPNESFRRTSGPAATHVAIAFRRSARPHQAEIFFPISPDAPTLPFEAGAPPSAAAFLYCEDPVDAGRAIEALATQDGSERLRLRVRAAPRAAAAIGDIEAKVASSRFESLDVAPAAGGFQEELVAAARETAAELLLVVGEKTVAHDRRALSCLLALMGAGGVASAACATVRERKAKKGSPLYSVSGGYFPAQVSLSAYPRLVASAADCLGAFCTATYPVLANELDFTLFRADIASALPAKPSRFGGERIDLALGMLGLRAGLRNLCASAIRVSSSNPEAAGEVSDAFSGGDLGPADWASILSRVTLLREL